MPSPGTEDGLPLGNPRRSPERTGGGQAELLLVGQAGGLARLFAGLGEDGEEDSGEDRNDGDHDEQLDQREAAPAAWLGFPVGNGVANFQ